MRFISIASTVLLAVSSIASAKDGAYVSANVGIGGLQKMSEQSFDAGFRGGFAFGYNIADSFAVEFNLQHQSNKLTNDNDGGILNSTIGFVNGYYFIPGLDKLKPYIGAGFGYGSVSANDNTMKGLSETSGVFALQGILGAKYEMCDKWDFFADLTYGHGFMLNSSSAGISSDYKPYGLRLGAAFKL